MARVVALPVKIVESLILDRDVGRISHDGMVLLAEDAVEFFGVLDFEVVGGFVFEDEIVAAEEAFAGDGVGFPLGIEAGTVQQRVADGEVHLEVRGAAQAFHLAIAPRRQQQPEAGDGHGEGIDVHAEHAVERLDRAFLVAEVGALPFPTAPASAGSRRAGSDRSRRWDRSCGRL